MLEGLEPRLLLSVYAVTNTLDELDAGDGVLSLREAVIAANAHPGSDVISLGAGTYTLTLGGPGMDATGGDLDLTDAKGSLTIRGVGVGGTILDGNGIDRVFSMASGTNVVIEDLTITHGLAVGETGGAISMYRSTVTLDSVTIDSNKAQAAADSYTQGGGIFAMYCNLTIAKCTIRNNVAQGGGARGGAIYAESSKVVILNGTTLSNNSAIGVTTYAFGGAIASSAGELHISDSAIHDNTAACGVYSSIAAAGVAGQSGGWASGGGIDESDSLVSVSGGEIQSNAATGGVGQTGGPLGSGGGPGGDAKGGNISGSYGSISLQGVDCSYGKATGGAGGQGGDPLGSGAAGAGGAGGEGEGGNIAVWCTLTLDTTTCGNGTARGGQGGPSGLGGISGAGGDGGAGGAASGGNLAMFGEEAALVALGGSMVGGQAIGGDGGDGGDGGVDVVFGMNGGNGGAGGAAMGGSMYGSTEGTCVVYAGLVGGYAQGGFGGNGGSGGVGLLSAGTGGDGGAGGNATGGAAYLGPAWLDWASGGSTVLGGPGGTGSGAGVDGSDGDAIFASLYATVASGAAYAHVLTAGGASAKWSYADSGGHPVQVALGGRAGSATLIRAVDGAGSADLLAIVARGTTSASTLSFTARLAPTAVSSVSVLGSLSKLDLSSSDLTGNLTVFGGIKTLNMHDTSDNLHSILLGSAPGGTTKIQSGKMMGVELRTLAPISSLTSVAWLRSASRASIEAPSIQKLSIAGRKAGGSLPAVKGDFAADLRLTDSRPKTTLGGVTISGDLSSQFWYISGSMGNLTVRGMAGGSSGLEVDTDQKMGVITLGGANKADFCAGAKYRHASNVGDLYSTQGAIKSVAITGWRGASGYLFVDSNFSAATIGKCILKNVNYSNASLAFGVWGQRIASVKLVDTAAPSDPTANFTWKPGSSAPAADLNILLLT